MACEGRPTFFFRLVGQHRANNDISDGSYAWNVGNELRVDLDTSFAVHLDASLF